MSNTVIPDSCWSVPGFAESESKCDQDAAAHADSVAPWPGQNTPEWMAAHTQAYNDYYDSCMAQVIAESCGSGTRQPDEGTPTPSGGGSTPSGSNVTPTPGGRSTSTQPAQSNTGLYVAGAAVVLIVGGLALFSARG